ncbi:MAG: hypothetical protein FWF59_04240 [Turicibacter sp.]|nr:hypothetical protein [Turicibacter sp.]
MKKPHQLKLSLAIAWFLLTSFSVAAFFVIFEEYEAIVKAAYHLIPMDLGWRDEVLTNANHTTLLYQLESGEYQLTAFHFTQAAGIETSLLVDELIAVEPLELFISSQAQSNFIQWRLDYYGSGLEPFLWTDYPEARQDFIQSGGLDNGVALKLDEPKVLFYFVHWLNEIQDLDFGDLLDNPEAGDFQDFSEFFAISIIRTAE